MALQVSNRSNKDRVTESKTWKTGSVDRLQHSNRGRLEMKGIGYLRTGEIDNVVLISGRKLDSRNLGSFRRRMALQVSNRSTKIE